MEPGVVVALITATASMAAAPVSALLSARSQLRVARLSAQLQRESSQEEQREEHERTIARFKEPLVYATYDLKSRFFNIPRLNVIEAYVEHGDERSKSYVVDNTVFLIAQYFAWIICRIKTGVLGRTRTCDLLIRSHSPSQTGRDSGRQRRTKPRSYQILALLEGQGQTGRDTRLRSGYDGQSLELSRQV